MLDWTPWRIEVAIALAVSLTWGFLAIVFFAQPDPFQPVRILDYVAVMSFSGALAVLAPGAWLIARVAGRAMALDRRTAVAALAAATLVGALTFEVGGLALVVAAWLVAGVAIWRGIGTVVRATAIITIVGALVAAFGNVIEDAFRLKDVGGAVFVAGFGAILVGLVGGTVSTALAGRFALGGLCAATVWGIVASAQYGGFVVMAVWLVFAAWIWRGHGRFDDRRGKRSGSGSPSV